MELKRGRQTLVADVPAHTASGSGRHTDSVCFFLKTKTSLTDDARTKKPPCGGFFGIHAAASYLTWVTIHSTVARTCSLLRAGLPPFAGILPLLPT